MSPYRLPDPALEAILGEDTPEGDATTFALGIADRPGVLEYRARGPMTLCGSEEAARMGQLRDLIIAGPVAASGSVLDAGQLILRLEGRAAALHAVWKTSQTLMEYLSGIASATAAIVAAARRGNPAASVACTRKNFPGTKAAAIKAILCGGATPHRLSLSETLLVFAEHRVFLDESPTATLARLRDALADGKAQSQAARRHGVLPAVHKAVEQMGQRVAVHAPAGVRHGDENAVIRITAFNQNGASLRRDGLVGILDQVVNDLFDLDGVQAEDGKTGLEVRVDLDAALLDFRFQQFQHFHEDGFNVVGFPDGPGGADGLEELLQDNVQPRGFALRCFQQFLHVRPVLWRQLLCLPGKELEMEAYGIEGVA